ncbi:MAG: helix-turn-helix transcriptional regulator [Alphaproteobacteria bacterium]|nr:helix-turn-helix transcriptional regulator [Alphaproteobacteria bacterium]
MTGHGKLLRLDSRTWHDQVAGLIAAVGTPQFASVMVETLEHVVPFDHSVFFAYRGQDRPLCLYDTFDPQQRIVFVSDYQEGPYLLDPFYQICAERIDPGLYRLREIAPDRFYHSEYYRSYYRRTKLAEEICFVNTLPDDMMLVISLMRAGTSPCFSDRHMTKLRKVEPIVHAAIGQHWRNLRRERDKIVQLGASFPSFGTHVARAFENFGNSVLTRREREVVRMVLRGHSSESIGRRFRITTGTVKIHRKNIYAKLGISSQSELFSLFISYL